jgi:hypothetical protein
MFLRTPNETLDVLDGVRYEWAKSQYNYFVSV